MISNKLGIPGETHNRTWSLSAKIADVIFPNIWFWVASVSLFLVDLTWIAASPGISVAPDSFTRMLAPVGMVFLLAFIRSAKLSIAGPLLTRMTCTGMVMLFVLLTIPALRIFNHLLMTLPFPMADDLLASWDEALGFSWLDYAKLIAGQHIAVELMKYAYAFFYFAVIAVALEATLAGRFFRCQELLALTLMTAVTSSLIACLFPARGTMDRFADNAFRLQFSPDAGIFFIPQLLSARGMDPVTLIPSSLAGLSTFPSFHTAAGILIIYACRGNSIRLAVGTAYSIVMIASTPVFGGHYFVDLIAGIALAIVMIMLWRLFGVKLVMEEENSLIS